MVLQLTPRSLREKKSSFKGENEIVVRSACVISSPGIGNVVQRPPDMVGGWAAAEAPTAAADWAAFCFSMVQSKV